MSLNCCFAKQGCYSAGRAEEYQWDATLLQNHREGATNLFPAWQEWVSPIFPAPYGAACNRFLAEQLQTLKQRIGHLSLEAQQMLTTACRRSDTMLRSEVRTECLKLDATLRCYDPAKVVTMDTSLENNTIRNAATIESLLTTSLNRQQQDLDANLKTIRVPTLIIHGDFDPIPVGSSDYIQQHISTSQLIVVKQSGHFPFVEQPEKFVAAVRAFMRP